MGRLTMRLMWRFKACSVSIVGLLACILAHVAAGADLLVGGRVSVAYSSHLYFPDDIVLWVGTCPIGDGASLTDTLGALPQALRRRRQA